MGVVTSKIFRSGNSEAVRLPKGIGFGVGTELRIERDGDRIVLTPVVDKDAVRREMAQLFADMQAIGTPPDGVQARPEFEMPEREGL